MQSSLLLLILAALASCIAFSPRSRVGVKKGLGRAGVSSSASASGGLARLSGQEGVRSGSELQMSEVTEFWEGDWVCADCGYIYDADIDDPKGQGRPFELMVRGFICPQCSAPRKRYAKAVNGQWGVTNDGGDLPIYAGTFLGLAITTWFALVYVPTL